jgi:DNA-binding NarL/FixJ family response regulator
VDSPVVMLESPLVSPPVVHLPKMDSRDPSLRLSTRTRATPRILCHSARVLIVDDNYFCRKALVEVFRREEDFHVCGEAGNGRDAIRAARLLRPDLIVLDLAMPAMNGLAAAQVLKRRMPSVPLILYGSAGKVVRQRTRALGIAALIPKVDPQDTVVNLARTLLAQKDDAVGHPTSLIRSAAAEVPAA